MPDSVFVPSELAYFHAARFASPARFTDSAHAPLGEAKVRGTEWSRAVLAVALLANEQAGALKLEAGVQSKLFGLRKVEALRARRVGDASWPVGTLEASFAAASAKGGEPRIVDDLVHEILEEDAPAPYDIAFDLVRRGLHRRGLLQVEERRTLKVFRSQVYVLPPETAAKAQEASPEEAAKLLDAASATRPDEWRLLQAALEAGIKRRKEYDTDAGPD